MPSEASGPAVGILANPASGRDIRRLVAQASVFQTAEKANMVARLLSGLGAVGVARTYMMPDRGGIAGGVNQAIEIHDNSSDQPWPAMTFFDMEIEEAPTDTLRAVERMLEAGVGAIAVLGGDGTNRLVASICGDVPLMPLSTGTNNVFPAMREATIAGLAAGLVATGQVSPREGCRRNKILRVLVDGRLRDAALVDLCVSAELFIGSKALWRPDSLEELFVCFAEADAIGLGSIAGLVRPLARDEPRGLRLALGPPETAPRVVRAPIAPGLVLPVGILAIDELEPGVDWPLAATQGVIALDGERELEFRARERVTVRLLREGPLTIDIDRVMHRAAEQGLLAR